MGSLVCKLCGAPAHLASDGNYRHSGQPFEDGSGFCDKYGYPIPVEEKPAQCSCDYCAGIPPIKPCTARDLIERVNDLELAILDLLAAKKSAELCAQANDRAYYVFRVIGRVERDGTFTDAHKIPEDCR